ncbi:MAG: hypothetical protein LBU12_09705 [Deltaproteobacteria bacterium]|jgi:hypothetical protein|nr:hypothetical protein [Deltaproteobacteria bacterium]
MLVSSDFLGFLARKKNLEKQPLVSAALKASPGDREKSPPVDKVSGDQRGRRANDDEVDYLNEKTSMVNVVL